MYDVSGIKSVELKYRLDKDGLNPIQDTANEVYESGEESWKGLALALALSLALALALSLALSLALYS